MNSDGPGPHDDHDDSQGAEVSLDTGIRDQELVVSGWGASQPADLRQQP